MDGKKRISTTYSCGHTTDEFRTVKPGESTEDVIIRNASKLCYSCYNDKLVAEAEEAVKAGLLEKIEMHYGEYKANYAQCLVDEDSYNKKTSTIVVYSKPRK